MVDVAAAQEFVRTHPRAVMATFRRDGRPALSPVTVALDDAGRVEISTRETAMKVKHLRRDPRVAVTVFTDAFYGEFVQLEGTAEIVELPEAMELLVDYYRRVSGEHPDWDDYRAAMQRDQRVIVRFAIERAGPTVSG
jgi:PPOX class probable F420-dependent enzyme